MERWILWRKLITLKSPALSDASFEAVPTAVGRWTQAPLTHSDAVGKCGAI
jgi:hypothetical protein